MQGRGPQGHHRPLHVVLSLEKVKEGRSVGGRTCSFKEGGLSTLAARARPGRCGRGPVHGLLSSADRGSSPGQAEQLRAALGWGWTPDCIVSPQRANKGSKAIERLRKKLSEQESLLLLMSPNMAFRVHSRHGKVRDRRPRRAGHAPACGPGPRPQATPTGRAPTRQSRPAGHAPAGHRLSRPTCRPRPLWSLFGLRDLCSMAPRPGGAPLWGSGPEPHSWEVGASP